MRGIRRKRAMFAVPGRQRRHWSWPRRFAVGGVLLVFMGLLVVGLGWPGMPSKPLAARITLESQKKLFGVGERPVLHLRINKISPRVGLLQPVVYASDLPEASVLFDGNKTPETAQVVPDGDDGYKVTLDSHGVIPRAGTYEVTVKGQTNVGQDFTQQTSFTWGALAVNTDKTVYTPGETAQLQFGVVGPKGNTVCNAQLAVTISDPGGQSSQVPVTSSPACHGDSYIDVPDYTATYVAKTVGTYTITVGVEGNSAYTIQQVFKVQNNVPFEVTRTGFTRLFPTHPYDMSLVVKVDQDFKGQIKEELPESDFKVTASSPAATSTIVHDHVVLSWSVDWKAGTTQQLAYSFRPPVRSPAFYALSPLVFTDQSGQQVFQEAHGWEYVGDATISFVKQTQFSVKTSAGPPTPNTSGAVSVTSTTGNTLILFFAQDDSGVASGFGNVTDSAGNTWVKPTTNPSQLPPANSFAGTSTEIAMAYALAATAISTITVSTAGSSLKDFAFNVVEFQNIDLVSTVDQSASGTHTGSGGTPDTQLSSAVDTTTCSGSRTAQQLRGGDYFCTSPNELVVTIIQAGKSSYTISTATDSWVQLTDLQMNSGSNVAGVPCTSAFSSCAADAYVITSATETIQATWTVIPANGVGKNTATGIMVFRQQPDPSLDTSKQNFFWAR